MGLKVSEKSVFLTNFGRGGFQVNLYSFRKRKVVTEDFIWCQMFVDKS